MKPAQKLIAVAQGEHPADLAITGAQVFNVFTGEFEQKDVLIVSGYIAALPPWNSPLSALASVRTNAKGQWLIPGFIDAHVHIESSMLAPAEFCALAAANGVTTLIADPHEIANILGLEGIHYMLDATEHALARVFFMLPSCVPASPVTKAAHTLIAADLQTLLAHPRILGLGEMMNFPGVLRRFPDVLEKLEAIRQYNEKNYGPLHGMPCDGHAPLLAGTALHAYVAAGISSDHEASTVQEAHERLAAGMGLMLREGSAAKNLLSLVPAVTQYTARRCMLCTDDRHPEDLVEQGSINYLVRTLVEDGRLALPHILTMASYNTACHFSLRHTGAIAPGYRADCALYPNLTTWKPNEVWNKGQCVAREGKPALPLSIIPSESLRGRVVLAEHTNENVLAVTDKNLPVKVIELVPQQLLTLKGTATLPARNGLLQADPQQDIAKIAVFERHKGTGRVGVSFIKGLGLTHGAIASTIAHDSHNLVVAGMNDHDMFLAVTALQRAGGGLAIAAEGNIVGLLPLPLAGIFSDRPVGEVYNGAKSIAHHATSLGLTKGGDPFMTLAFMSLDVIPHLKLTDCGLVDGDTFTFTSLYAE